MNIYAIDPTMVFSSYTSGRIPKTTDVEYSTPLYVLFSSEIRVHNHFNEDADFQLKVESYDEEDINYRQREAKKKYERD